MLVSLAIWLENLGLFTYVRGSGAAYPTILALHLVFISLFAGMVLVTDIRLLGWALRGQAISDIVNQLRVPKRIGFLLVATCGILLFGSKAEEYYYNIFFRIKLSLFALIFVHSLVFRSTVYDNAAQLEAKEIPGRAKLAARLSILLWLCVVCAGRGIGYVPAPFGFHYAKLFSAAEIKK